MPVTAVYFCYAWTLWLFQSGIPQFFKNEFHLDLQKSALFASGVFFAGFVGDTLGGITSDHLFRKTKSLNIARRNLVALMMVLCCASMVPILFTHNLTLVAISLSAGFFFAEFTIGPDVGHSHGYRPEIRGHGERNDEYRFSFCCNRFTRCVWLCRR